MGLKEDRLATQATKNKSKSKGKGDRRAHKRSAMNAAKATSTRSAGQKVRTQGVQAKKDHNVATHSGGKYSSVAEMQKAGDVDPITGRRPPKTRRERLNKP